MIGSRDSEPARRAVEASRQALAERWVRYLERFDLALVAGNFAQARSVLDSLARLRGTYRQEAQLVIDAKWAQLNNARRSRLASYSRTLDRRRCRGCGADIDAVRPSATHCEVCAPAEGPSVRAVSAGLPTLGKRPR